MRGRALPVIGFAWFLSLLPVAAQQGHPLTGTWTGDWGATPTQRTAITLVMNWDGKNVTGLMNPGPEAAPLAEVAPDGRDYGLMEPFLRRWMGRLPVCLAAGAGAEAVIPPGNAELNALLARHGHGPGGSNRTSAGPI